MTTDQFPFAFPFDADKVKEMFKTAAMPTLDTDSMFAAQKKNMDAFIAVNTAVAAGYQDIYKRQVALAETAMTEAKTQFAGLQGQPLTMDQATQNGEAMKAAFEKAAAGMKELAELAQKANTGAFEIVKARVEEATAEFKAAADKVAA